LKDISSSENERGLARHNQPKQTQQRSRQLKALQQALQTGFDSGMSNKNVLDIKQEVEAKLTSKTTR